MTVVILSAGQALALTAGILVTIVIGGVIVYWKARR